jgi:hypothetical protein
MFLYSTGMSLIPQSPMSKAKEGVASKRVSAKDVRIRFIGVSPWNRPGRAPPPGAAEQWGHHDVPFY